MGEMVNTKRKKILTKCSKQMLKNALILTSLSLISDCISKMISSFFPEPVFGPQVIGDGMEASKSSRRASEEKYH